MILFHVVAMIGTGLLVLFADEQGLMWILGKKETLSPRRIHLLHILVSVGLAGIVTTGVLMVLPWPEYYLAQTTFQIKMGFVGVLVVNAFFIGHLSRIATAHAFKNVPSKQRVLLLVSGAISVAGWLGALVCGLLLGG
jgi:hypothetical protein